MTKLLITAIALLLLVSGCDTKEEIPEYQLSIEAKYKALGWTLAADDDGKPQKTASGNGWVQYYGAKDRAIYYLNGTSYAVLKGEMNKYDSRGQDNFALITSDSQTAAGGLTYNEIEAADNPAVTGIIIATSSGVFIVIGEIYKEYVRLRRWEGALQYPISNEGNLTSGKGRYSMFKGGQIYWSPTTGAHGFWGKQDKLYANAGYDTGWLGLPLQSVDQQSQNGVMSFENGQISVYSTCARYLRNSVTVYVNGNPIPAGQSIPCY